MCLKNSCHTHWRSMWNKTGPTNFPGFSRPRAPRLAVQVRPTSHRFIPAVPGIASAARVSPPPLAVPSPTRSRPLLRRLGRAAAGEAEVPAEEGKAAVEDGEGDNSAGDGAYLDATRCTFK